MLENKILLLAQSDEADEITAYLKEADYQVVTAHVASDASDLLNEEYCLVLSHVELLTDDFMSVAKGACVPVMCLVDEDKKEKSVEKLYASGCVDYVTLPTHKRILQTRVKTQIDVKADELSMHMAKDYLNEFAVTVSHDIKNQFTVSARLSQWLLDSGHEKIDEESKIILTHLANFCTKTQGMLEAIEDRTVNESRHRGGFVRKAYNNA